MIDCYKSTQGDLETELEVESSAIEKLNESKGLYKIHLVILQKISSDFESLGILLPCLYIELFLTCRLLDVEVGILTHLCVNRLCFTSNG